MELHEFEQQMTKILTKVSEVSDSEFCELVSVDPDCIAEFGCDHEGNLSIMDCSFPLKIKDITRIRYRWNPKEFSCMANFYRFEFGENIYLDCSFDDCGNIGEYYSIHYNDESAHEVTKEEIIELIKNCITSND